jgi:hypothetical protein
MRSTVVMSLGVLNTYGSSAMAHKPPPINIKRCPTLSSILSKYMIKNAAKIGRATNAARLPSIILAVLYDISKSAGLPKPPFFELFVCSFRLVFVSSVLA